MKSVREKKCLKLNQNSLQRFHGWNYKNFKGICFLEQGRDFWLKCDKKWNLEGRHTLCTTVSCLYPEMDFCQSFCLSSVCSGHYFCGKIKELLNHKSKKKLKRHVCGFWKNLLIGTIFYTRNLQNQKLWETTVVGQFRSSFLWTVGKSIKNENVRLLPRTVGTAWEKEEHSGFTTGKGADSDVTCAGWLTQIIQSHDPLCCSPISFLLSFSLEHFLLSQLLK